MRFGISICITKSKKMNVNDLEKVYETLLSVPGMNDTIKVDLKVPRKTVLMLTEVLRKGMATDRRITGFGIADTVSETSQKELEDLIGDCLDKAGLTELSGKLRSLV
jgi:hypothetical protein